MVNNVHYMSIYFNFNDLLSKESEQSCIRVSRVSEYSKAGREVVRKI